MTLLELTQTYQLKLGYLEEEALRLTKIGAAGQKLELSCSKGCAYCCHLGFTATIPEGIMAAVQASRLGVTEEAAENTARRMGHMGPGAWFKKQLPCLFLHESVCQIYEARPAACRFHWAVTAAKLCAEDRAHLVDPFDFFEARDILSQLFMDEWTNSLMGRPRQLLFPAAVALGLKLLRTGHVDKQTLDHGYRLPAAWKR